MLYAEEVANRGAALKREAEIKTWSRAQKLAMAATRPSFPGPNRPS
jgi:predicted GIY-YIG superfamily endonuclease